MRGAWQVLVSVLLFGPAALGVTVEQYDPSKDFEANARKQNNDPNRKWCHVKQVPNPKGSGWVYSNKNEYMQECIKSCPHYSDRDNIHSAVCGYVGGWTEPPFEYKKGMCYPFLPSRVGL